jgi:hypothetical protein
MGIDIKFLLIHISRLEKVCDVLGNISSLMEPQSHRWPAIFVGYRCKTIGPENVIHIDMFGMACIGHSMVTDEDNINYVG